MYRCITPGAVELYDREPQKHIEMIGRVCYKSEDKITDDSDKKFIANMHSRNHWAMLEHFRFIMEVSSTIYFDIMRVHSPYITMTEEAVYDGGDSDVRYMISASARGLMDAMAIVNAMDDSSIKDDMFIALTLIIKHIVWHYGCVQMFGGEYTPCKNGNVTIIEREYLREWDYTSAEIMAHDWHSVKFTCDRGVTHELVRHRPASFAQESTRYCNYSLGKFNEAIGVIRPFEFKDGTEQFIIWEKCMHYLNEMYQQLIHAGASPQWARSILPQSTKADIVITCPLSEWQHIINLRYIGTTGAPIRKW